MLLTVSAHYWYDVGWVDWATVAGLLLGLAGLLSTWRQARKAADAANAARSAIQQTEKQIRTKQLMVLVPQLKWIVGELDSAIESGNPQLVRRNFENWRMQASYVHGILSATNSTDKVLPRCISKSVSLAAVASGALLAGGAHASSACTDARVAIAAACDGLNSWVGRNSTQGMSPEEN